MGRFNDGGRDRGDRGRGRFDSRDRGEKEMFQTTCANCGQSCEVPFKPRGDRPVYCRECFKKQENGDSRFGGGDRGRSSFGEKKMFTATCDNCGNSCEVPFRPTGEKPVYCKDCFGKMGGRSGSRDQGQQSSGQSDVAAQLKAMNSKLDAILHALVPVAKTSAVKAPAVAKEMPKSESKKVVKKAKPKKAAKKAR